MNDKQFNAILEIKIESLVALIMEQQGLSFEDALSFLYTSKLFEKLAIEELKLWHLSFYKLYDILKHEHETGKLLLPDFV